MEQIIWRRLDVYGHDACWLEPSANGWSLEGRAVWLGADGPAHADYRVEIDQDWHSQQAQVTGRIGGRSVTLHLRRDTDGRWCADGQPLAGCDGLDDVDLGFTPATNLMPLRRWMQAGSGGGPTTAVWLDPTRWECAPLPQEYAALGAGQWQYRSPRHDYQAVLSVDPRGFVTEYPGLWRAVG